MSCISWVKFKKIKRYSKSSFPYFFGIAILFLELAVWVPHILAPLYKWWMKLAYYLNWFSTRVVLGIAFYLMFTPLGFFARLFRIDILDQKFKRPELQTYWKKRANTPFNKENYEQQY
jgi:hypothetical protein